jgi:ACS family glucarate transporter-like MFS transporter
LIVIRFCLGAGEAVLYPASNQFVERWFPRDERGRANGIIFAGVGLGAGMTPPLITAIMISYGWRAPFWLCAGLGIFAGIVWYTIARDEPEHHRSIKSTELAYIVRGRDAAQSLHNILGEDKKETIPWERIVTSREALLLTTSYFAFCYMTWIFFGWFYIYLVQVRGLDQRSSALYTSLPFVAMTLGCVSGGVLSDTIVRRWNLRAGRCWLTLACMAISSALLVLAADAPYGQEASIISAASMGILYMCANCFWSTVNDIAGRLSSVVSGLMNMGGQIGGAVAASVTPLVAKNHGWAASFLVAGAIGGAGAILWVAVDPRSSLQGKSMSTSFLDVS